MKNLLTSIRIRVADYRPQHVALVLGDGAIATAAIGEGRLITVLILDKSSHKEIYELAVLQARAFPGDVVSQWGASRDNKTIALVLDFKRPILFKIAILFDVVKQGLLVDNILRAQAVYLQAGEAGDRISTTFEHPKVLVEVPNAGFPVNWEKLWTKALAKEIQSSGQNRQKSKDMAEHMIALMRSITKAPKWKR